MLFALDIFVNEKAPPTHSVHWGLNLHYKNINLIFFAKPHIKSSKYLSPPF